MTTIPEVSIDDLIERYDALLFDAYGVLVHSTGAMPGAVALIERLNRLRKPYYIVTNDVSKLPATAAARYRGYGLALDAERIISAGALLKEYFATHGLAGARCGVLGPGDSAAYVVEAGGIPVSPAEDFDVFVVADDSGFPFIETMNAAFNSVCRRVDRDRPVHLVVPNPDLVYPRDGETFCFAAGSFALMFEAALRARYPAREDLTFARLGKPDPAIFAEALRRSGTRRMVMIGDQLETDIRGARGFGLDAAWLSTGVTAPRADIPHALRPTYRLRSLGEDPPLR